MNRPAALRLASLLIAAFVPVVALAADDEAKGTVPGGLMTIGARPLSISVPLDAAMAARIEGALRANPPATVRLTLRAIAPPVGRDHCRGLRIFVNRPDANAETPASDPGCVGAIDFAPTTEGNPETFLVDIGPTLVQLRSRGELRSGRPLTISLVAIPGRPGAAIPSDFRLPIRSVSISVPKPR